MIRTTLIILISIVGALQSAVQFEVKGYDILGESEAGNKAYTSNGGAITGFLHSSFTIAPELALFFTDEFDKSIRLSYSKPGDDPVVKQSPFAEKKIPSSNNFEVGLRFTNVGIFNVSYKNMWYFDTVSIWPSYIQENSFSLDTVWAWDASMKRVGRNIINTSWLLPIEKFSLFADVSYFGLSYVLNQSGYDYNTDVDTLVEVGDRTYADLWSRFALGWDFSPSLNFRAGFLNKNDLSTEDNNSRSSAYDLYRYNMQFEGVHEFPSNNRVTWIVSGQWYENEIMRENNFATGPGMRVYLRDVLEIGDKLFLKGMAGLELGRRLYKERFDVGLRKAFDNESYLESGYFNTQGGVFPTQGYYARSKVYIPPKVSIALNFKSLYEGPDSPDHNRLRSENKTELISAGGNCEVALAFVKNGEVFSGVDYTQYNADIFREGEDFPSRFGGYMGIRMWVQ